MTDKDMYMIGYNVLHDIKENDGSRMTKEEGEAFQVTINTLARLYTNEAMWDIRMGANEKSNDDTVDVMCDEVMESIPIYNRSAEKGLQDSIAAKKS